MRDYAKVLPKFWQGETGRELAAKGAEALVVAMYLMTSPHSNMLGLYYQPVLYMADETGLSPEGASKGLEACMESGFCDYDPITKMVWVFEMASYQIGSDLDPKDKRCKGIQKDYNALPNTPFLGPFFDRYAERFHLTDRREYAPKSKAPVLTLVSPLEAPSKPRTRTRTGERTGTSAGPADKLPAAPVEKIIDLYQSTLPELPGVRLHTKDRVRSIRKVWEWVLTSLKPDHTRRATNEAEALDWFRLYFERVRDNDFLMGRTARDEKHRNWKCDIDFLLTDNGMKHVIEKTDQRGAA